MELQLFHFVGRRHTVPPEVIEDRFPVNTFIAIPMGTARIFIITEVGMESTQYFTHAANLFDRNDIVRIAVKNVNARLQEVLSQIEDTSGIGRLANHREMFLTDIRCIRIRP